MRGERDMDTAITPTESTTVADEEVPRRPVGRMRKLPTDPKDPNSPPEMFKFTVKCAAAIVWSFTPTAAGLLLTLTTIGAIVGIPLLIIGAYPLYYVIRKRTEQQNDWINRGRVLDVDEGVPWLM